MAVFKCKMCGGSLEIAEGTTVCECEYCGTQQTLPKNHDDVLTNLFNRANNLRMKSEFDKAQELYEKIVGNNPGEAEAYWGIVLCKYGIEYVEDPATLAKVPTCHRTQLGSVMTDVDYQSALENADGVQRGVYEREAAAIDKLQKDILAIVHNEKPFDVFICYKESDESGRRTPDSVIANDIYHQLTQEGFKVFYAAITLEDKLGREYEPYIFAALTSAKVMLSIGTKPEYFNAVWVKNEWSRYIKLMKADRSKLLIPCYKDMDAYDLPEEFSHLQAQDMGKIGFINDLIRGIKKVIVRDEPKPAAAPVQTVVQAASSNVENLLKRGFLALEDKDWNAANAFFEQVLNEEVEEARAYIGKLLVELRLSDEDVLLEGTFNVNASGNFKKAMRFAKGETKEKLEKIQAARDERYNSFILKNNELTEKCEVNIQKISALKKEIEKADEQYTDPEFPDEARIAELSDNEEKYEKLRQERFALEKEIDELSMERSKLGFFQGKRIKEIKEKVSADRNKIEEISKILSSEKDRNAAELSRLKLEKIQYLVKNKNDFCKPLEDKIQALLTENLEIEKALNENNKVIEYYESDRLIIASESEVTSNTADNAANVVLYDLWLDSCKNSEAKVIKCVKEMLNLDLRESMSLVKKVPTILTSSTDYDYLDRWCKKILSVGAAARIVKH